MNTTRKFFQIILLLFIIVSLIILSVYTFGEEKYTWNKLVSEAHYVVTVSRNIMRCEEADGYYAMCHYVGKEPYSKNHQTYTEVYIVCACHEKLGEKIINSIDLLYSDNNERIGSYASLVFDAYAMGDKTAAGIIERRINHLIHSLNRARELHGGGNHVVLAGGLTAQREILAKFLSDTPFTFHFPTLPPIYGACRYCAIQCGGLSDNFSKNFELTYKK